MSTTKGTKAKKVVATETQATLDAVKGLDLTTVIGEIGTLQVEVQNTLAGLGASLSSKIQQMKDVDAAIQLKQGRLAELCEIENEAITIDDLRAQRDLEAQEWQRRKQERDTQYADEMAQRDKVRKREADEHVYTTRLNQQRVKDEFDAEIARLKRDEEIRAEALRRDWDLREAELASKEEEVENLTLQVAGFDAKLKAEVARAEGVLSNTLKRQYEHEIDLLKRDALNQQRVSEVQAEMQEQTIEGLREQIVDLGKQLAAARNDAREVATQALQSASGRQVVEALQRSNEVRTDAPTKTR